MKKHPGFLKYSIVLTLVTLPYLIQAQRIITAGSAISEIVCALGDCEKIVGTDRTSLYPASLQSLPSIGYRSTINAEGIISLRPTLIIAEKDYVDNDVLKQLASTGIKLVTVEPGYSFDNSRKMITHIASVLGREAEGKKLIEKNERELAAAKALVPNNANVKALCIFNRGTSTITIAGKDTFGEILQYTGTTNAIQGVQGYKPLNTEALIAANPDFIVMTSSGLESLGGIDGVLKLPGVAQTNAGKKRQIVAVETLKLTNFGPRFGEAVSELTAHFYGTRTAKP